jgi:hypothetical protein
MYTVNEVLGELKQRYYFGSFHIDLFHLHFTYFHLHLLICHLLIEVKFN